MITEEKIETKFSSSIPLNGDMSTPMNVYQALRQIRDPKYTVEDQTYINTKRFFIPVDREKIQCFGTSAC